jgi:uncharacterized OB-fold protein
MTSDPLVVKPLPVTDEVSQDYWASAAAHVLSIQRCAACGTYQYPPSATCRACLSPEREFRYEPVSGRGHIKTWTVVHQAFLPAWRHDAPYVVAVVELAEQDGLYFPAYIVGAAAAEMTLGAAVEVEFEDLAEGVSVPHFRMAVR